MRLLPASVATWGVTISPIRKGQERSLEPICLLSDLTELAALLSVRCSSRKISLRWESFPPYRARIQERPGHDFGLRADDSRGRIR